LKRDNWSEDHKSKKTNQNYVGNRFTSYVGTKTGERRGGVRRKNQKKTQIRDDKTTWTQKKSRKGKITEKRRWGNGKV